MAVGGMRSSLTTYVAILTLSTLLLDVESQQGAGKVMHVYCSEKVTYSGKEVGDVVNIYSDDYPNYDTDVSNRECFIKLEACVRCRFRVEINAEFPSCQSGPLTIDKSQCGSQGCKTLLIYDTIYHDTAAVRVLGGHATSYPKFTTLSNFVTLKYCKHVASGNAKFNVTIYTVEKAISYNSDSGVVISPNFPYGYYARKEVYTYTIQSPSKKKQVILKCVDWQLNQNADSKLLITSVSNGVVTYSKTYFAKSFRPMLFLSGDFVNLTFFAGSTQGPFSSSVKYIGFKIVYEFTSAVRVDLPQTDCGEYFSISKGSGGEIKLHRTRLEDNLDCIWVVPRPPKFTNLMLKMEYYTFSVADASPTMTIYGGMTSYGMPLLVEEPLSVISTRHTSNDGLFIRLQGKVNSVNIKMLYLSYARSRMGVCKSNTVLCADFGNVCIDDSLLKSGWDKRCGSDLPPPTTAANCGWRVCKDERTCYKWCDGIAQCPDNFDEQNCPSGGNVASHSSFNVKIVVPVLVLFIGVPIVVIPGFLITRHLIRRRTIRRSRRRRNLLHQYAHQSDHHDRDNAAFSLEDDGVYRRPGSARVDDERNSPTIRGVPPPSYHSVVSPLDDREQFFLRDRPPSYRAVLTQPNSYRLSLIETKPENMEPPPSYESVSNVQTQLFSDIYQQNANAARGFGNGQPPEYTNSNSRQNNTIPDDQRTLLQRLSDWALRSAAANGDQRNGAIPQGRGPSRGPGDPPRRMSADVLGTQGSTPFTISRGYSLDSQAVTPQVGVTQPLSLGPVPEGQRSNDSQGQMSPGQQRSSSENASHEEQEHLELNHQASRLATHGRQSSEPHNTSDHMDRASSEGRGLIRQRAASFDADYSPGQVRGEATFPWIRRESRPGSGRNTAGDADCGTRSETQHSQIGEGGTNRVPRARDPSHPYRPPRSVSYRPASELEQFPPPARRVGSEFSVHEGRSYRPSPRRLSEGVGGPLSRYQNRPLHSSLSNLLSGDLEQRGEGSQEEGWNSPNRGMDRNIRNQGRKGSLPSLLHSSSYDLRPNPQNAELEGTRPARAAYRPVPAPRSTGSVAGLTGNTSQGRPPVPPKPNTRRSSSHNVGEQRSQTSGLVPCDEWSGAADTQEDEDLCSTSWHNSQNTPSEGDGTSCEFVNPDHGATSDACEGGPNATYV